jgi:hypothetical protein
MGVALFLRETRPVQLTDAGRVFIDQARQIVAHVDQLTTAMHRLSSPRFIVGVVGSIMQGAMPDMIRRFRDACPQVEVELVEMTTVQQVAALKEGRSMPGWAGCGSRMPIFCAPYSMPSRWFWPRLRTKIPPERACPMWRARC